MVQEATAMGNWWLAASSQQPTHSCIISHAEIFKENRPHDSASLEPRFGNLQLLAFLKTKITFERKEISDHGWGSRKYIGTAYCNWQNFVRSPGAFFEVDWGIIVLCSMFLTSSWINVCIFHITWLDTFWTDIHHCEFRRISDVVTMTKIGNHPIVYCVSLCSLCFYFIYYFMLWLLFLWQEHLKWDLFSQHIMKYSTI